MSGRPPPREAYHRSIFLLASSRNDEVASAENTPHISDNPMYNPMYNKCKLWAIMEGECSSFHSPATSVLSGNHMELGTEKEKVMVHLYVQGSHGVDGVWQLRYSGMSTTSSGTRPLSPNLIVANGA